MNLKPIATEKAVMMIEALNILAFEVPRNVNKNEIKKEVEETLEIKVEAVRTQIRNGKKIAYVKLNKKNLAIDVATKIGLM
ncbi:MAG: 50S ribosomal protein L23 [Nanoarchaeota archaeon]